MANVTDGEKQSTTQELFCETGFEARQKMLILISSFPLAVVAFLGNAVIIAALRNVSTLHPSSKILLVCLACTDLGVGLISHPLLIGYLMSEGHLKICSYLGIIFYTIGFTLCGVSLLTLTAISVDRLLALLLRLRYKDVVTVKRARILVVAIWLVSPAGVVVVLYNFRIAAGLSFAVVVPCVAISTLCYTKIYHTLRHHQTQAREQIHQGKPHGRGIQLKIARYKKTVSSVLWVQITLLVCYLPYLTVAFIYSISRQVTPALRDAVAVTLSLLLCNSSLNPFLYFWKIREVKQAVKETVRQFWCFSRQL